MRYPAAAAAAAVVAGKEEEVPLTFTSPAVPDRSRTKRQTKQGDPDFPLLGQYWPVCVWVLLLACAIAHTNILALTQNH